MSSKNYPMVPNTRGTLPRGLPEVGQPPGVLDGSDNVVCLPGSLRQEVFITVAYF